ncbi:MAG: sigma-54 dependent transcriptional regulator [Oceanococcaceae bacterium]
MPRILIIDDEADIRATVEILLGRAGLDTRAADSVKAALSWLEREPFDAVLTDMRLGDGTGLDVVRWIRQHRPTVPVAVITAYGAARDAVTALKAGAFDYIEKPVDSAVLRRVAQEALQLNTARAASARDGTSPDAAPGTDDLTGQSPPMQALRDLVARLARTIAPVYIHGESGVGKERAARAIHRHSARANKPFVAINCGAIPADLFESELFGHIKGSFSGAHTDRDGLFSAADGGSLFLDEVADLPLPMQVKLLRAVQERRIRPVGSNHELPVDVRVISASQQPLEHYVRAGQLREDLYYRLNVLTLAIPPLRERRDDIPALCHNLLARIAERHGRPPPDIDAKALSALQARDFPGNIRELENTLEQALALAAEPQRIQRADLPDSAAVVFSSTPPPYPAANDSPAPPAASPPSPARNSTIDDELAQTEEQRIRAALEATRWNRTKAAKALGISFRSLRYRLQKLGIEGKPN